MLLRFTLRHLLRHWRMNLVVLAGLLLAATFLAALPPYATAIAGRSLAQRLADASPAARNIRVSGEGLNAALYGNMQALLGDLLRDRIEVREAEMDGLSAIFTADQPEADGRPFDEVLILHPFSFSQLDPHVTVIEGRLPEHLGPVPNQSYSVLEAVIGRPTAEQLELTVGVGNQLTVMHLKVGDQLRSADGSLRVNIVGVVEPAEPESDVWWQDLRPFSFERRDIWSVLPDKAVPALIVPPASMDAYFPGYQRHWRVLTDISKITVDSVETYHAALSRAEVQLRVTLDTSLIQMIDNYQAQLATARVTLYLLTIQSLIFVFYTLAMIASFVLDQSRGELASLTGRGFTSRQITQIFALQGILLALVAAPVGPFLAKAALGVWGRLTETVIPSAIMPESWWLVLAAVFFSWLTLVVSIYMGAHGNILDWQRQVARPAQRASWQKYYLDIFLLVLGGLIYWQLADTGTFIAATTSDPALSAAGVADPLLLLGPSLLLIAAALVFLRAFPYLLRLAAWWSRRVEGLILPFGLAKLSRDPVGPSRVVLLICLAAGLTLFASLFEHSLAVRQTEIAHYRTGADLRVGLPIGAGEAEYRQVAGLPGVTAASPVYRNVRSRWSANLGRQAEMIAVEPETLSQVTRFAPHISSLSIAAIMPALEWDGRSPVPAVFSHDAPPLDKEVGDMITYAVGQHKVTFEIRGIIQNFPLLSSPFYITNLEALENTIDLTSQTEPWVGQREVWLAVNPAQHEALVNRLQIGDGPVESFITGDARALERQLKSDLVAQETLGAFALNAFTLAGLSVAIFLLVHFFAAQQRLYEFSVLRATGLSTRQLLGLLSLEGVAMMVLGLVAGSSLGYGLALIMRPFLSRTLSSAVGGDALHEILFNWLQVSGLYVVLVGFYALALVLLLLFLLRAGIHRALRLGEE